MKYSCTRLVTGDHAVSTPHGMPATVSIEQGVIVDVQPGLDPTAEVLTGWVVPGFVDTHCHGGGGFDFTADDPHQVHQAMMTHRRHGTTTQWASTVTASIPDIVNQIYRLKDHVARGDFDAIHLEGPFLADERAGAHAHELLINPSPGAWRPLVEAAGGAVRMITVAPERPGALLAINEWASLGIMPAFGHSDAAQSQVRDAVEAGCGVATHLFNAMRGIGHRDPGLIPYLLSDDEVAVELICDGIHVHPDVLRMAIRAAGVHRVMLVTDAMSAADCPDGSYTLGGLDVQVRDRTARIVMPDGTLGPIAGSTLTMDRAFAMVVKTLGFSVPQAVEMASVNPARVHGISLAGSITPGKWADLCVLDDHIQLRRVMRRGKWVDDRGSSR